MSVPPHRRWYQFSLRTLLALVTLAAVGMVGLLALVPVFSYLNNPWADFDGSDEFVGLPGDAAKRQLSVPWPRTVEPSAVESMSYKSQWSRDSYSTWSQILITPTAAANLADYIHAEQAATDKSSTDHWEGIQRSIAGPPPLHRQTGLTPSWWLPPPAMCRATEKMHWYDTGSGVARATYTTFDPNTNTLWIYEYACQPDQLWSQGSMPNGVSINEQ